MAGRGNPNVPPGSTKRIPKTKKTSNDETGQDPNPQLSDLAAQERALRSPQAPKQSQTSQEIPQSRITSSAEDSRRTADYLALQQATLAATSTSTNLSQVERVMRDANIPAPTNTPPPPTSVQSIEPEDSEVFKTLSIMLITISCIEIISD